jgi:hypothetical protein
VIQNFSLNCQLFEKNKKKVLAERIRKLPKEFFDSVKKEIIVNSNVPRKDCTALIDSFFKSLPDFWNDSCSIDDVSVLVKIAIDVDKDYGMLRNKRKTEGECIRPLMENICISRDRFYRKCIELDCEHLKESLPVSVMTSLDYVINFLNQYDYYNDDTVMAAIDNRQSNHKKDYLRAFEKSLYLHNIQKTSMIKKISVIFTNIVLKDKGVTVDLKDLVETWG